MGQIPCSTERISCVTNRIVNMWNSLPNDVVHEESTNTFKSRLDKFWYNQKIIYDYRAEIQGTGSRSVIY